MTQAVKSNWCGIGYIANDLINSITLDSTASDAVETNFDLDVVASSSNGQDIDGSPYGTIGAYGSQSVSTTVTVRTGGYPDTSAAFTYSLAGDATEYGQTPPTTALTGFETIFGNIGALGYREPQGLALSNGVVLFAVEDWVNNRVLIRSRATTGLYSTSFAFAASPTAFVAGPPIQAPSPALTILETGRIICAYLEVTSATVSTLKLAYSDDNGVTFNPMVTSTLTYTDTNVSQYDKLRIAYDRISRNFVILVRKYAGAAYSSLSYVSSDSGLTWGQIETAVANAQIHSIVASCGRFMYLYVLNTDYKLYTKRTSAGTSSWVAGSVTVSGFDPTQMAAVVMPNQEVWVLSRSHGVGLNLFFEVATNDWGASFHPYQTTYPPNIGLLVADDGTAGFLSGIKINSLVYQRGQVFCAGNPVTIAATVTNTPMAMVCGAFSNVTPFFQGSDVIAYYPVDVPGSRGWTATGAGTDTILQDGANRIVDEIATVANQRLHSYSGTLTTEGLMIAQVYPAAGGSTTARDIAIDMLVGTGILFYEVALNFKQSTNQIGMRDINGAATLATVTVTAGVPIQVLLAVNNATCSAWWKEIGSTKWISIATNQILTSAGAGTTAYKWGHISAAGTATSQWHYVRVQDSANGFADGASVADLLQIPLPSDGGTLANGITVKGNGSFTASDVFTVNNLSRTGFIRAIEPKIYPSPRENFQGATLAAATTYSQIFSVDPAYYGEISDVIGLATLGCYNVERVKLDRWNGVGWVNLIDLSLLDTPLGTAPSWQRTNAGASFVLVPFGTNGYPRYCYQDEFAGMLAIVDDGAGNIIITPVIGNTDGQFSNAAGVKQVNLLLSQTPISGNWAAMPVNAGGGGSILQIVQPDGFQIATQTLASQIKYRLQFKTIVAGTVKIGSLYACSMALFDRDADVGWQDTWTPNDEVVVLPYAFKRARRLAPVGRTQRIPLRQMILSQNRYQGGTAINTLGPGATARAVVSNALDQTIALAQKTGHTQPVIWISQMASAADFSTPITLLGKRQWLLGRLERDVAATMAQGLRWGATTGVHRGDTELVIVEEV